MGKQTLTDGTEVYTINNCECHKGTLAHPAIYIRPFDKVIQSDEVIQIEPNMSLPPSKVMRKEK
jgi:hypothetical protein